MQISLKKFHANTIKTLSLLYILDLFFIGIPTPGINLLCFNLLSSIINSLFLNVSVTCTVSKISTNFQFSEKYFKNPYFLLD